MKRESFASRLGFLLVSAGCAIGIGNVWRFPYEAGRNGGGIFVLFYLLFLVIMGAPVLTMELAVGRAGKSSALKAYKALEPKGSKWHIHGVFCMVGCYILMMYYTTVSGWMLSYFFKFLTGTFDSVPSSEVGGVFSSMLANPGEMTAWMAVTVIAGFLVVSLGLQNGLERITKVMMSALLVLIVVLAVHSLTLSGAKDGLTFYLVPDMERAMQQGLGSVITAAMNQAFFTLSLGIGAMEIFGSYMSRDNTLGGESLRICALDTFVAIASGLIIFPACFSFGVEPDVGPSLIFVTLPNVFINMSGGRIWGTLFFLFMTFASFSTVIAVFENLLANCIDNFGWDRKKAVVINAVFILIASLPCVFGYNIWSNLHLIGGRDVLDTEDFLVSNLLLPGGSLVYLLFCVSKWGWGYDNYLEEANTGTGWKLPKSKLFKVYLQFVLPVLILIILVQGLR
ncbi:MAG: sodium-dependent transporter [Gemmiger sp.]